MKNRLLFLFVLVLTFGLGLTSYAQSDQQQPSQEQGEHHGKGHGHGGPPSADQELAHMTKTLNLTSDQQAKIKPMLDDSFKQMQSVHSDTSLSEQDRSSKMQEIHKSLSSEVREVLTPDQQTKFDSMMKDHGHHHGGTGGQTPPSQQ